VRRQAGASNFFPEACNFFRENFDAAGDATPRQDTKSPAKHEKSAQPTTRDARDAPCSRKRRVKSFFTLPLQCNGQSVVWSRVADSVA
jgi:hypothetical protein